MTGHLASVDADDCDGLEWTDEGLVIHRLPWMSDSQWAFTKERMTAAWEEFWADRKSASAPAATQPPAAPPCTPWCDGTHGFDDTTASPEGWTALALYPREAGKTCVRTWSTSIANDWERPDAVVEVGVSRSSSYALAESPDAEVDVPMVTLGENYLTADQAEVVAAALLQAARTTR